MSKVRSSAQVFVAVLTAATAVQSQCIVGLDSAQVFNAPQSQGITVPSTSALSGLTDFTFEFWFRRSPSGLPGPTNMTVFDMRQSVGSGPNPVNIEFNETASLNGGQARLCIAINWDGSATDATLNAACGTAGPFLDNFWRHAAIVRQGGTFTLYINGAVDPIFAVYGGGNSAAPLLLGSFPLRIGFGVHHLHGALNELRIWSVARTAGQINATMNRGLYGDEPGLLAYWRFDENGGQTAFNSAQATGPSLNGVLGSAPVQESEDPTWESTNLPPLPYCTPCPNAPCGQVNTPCATLAVNGLGIASQGPLDILVSNGGTLTFAWQGPPGQPFALVASPTLIPGQTTANAAFIIDVDVVTHVVVFNPFDPFLGPLFFLNAAGTSVQTFAAPSSLFGTTIGFQGLVYDLNLTCSNGLGFMTTAAYRLSF